MSHSIDSNDRMTMNRRDAIKRTALLLGAAVSSSTIAGCLGEDRSSLGPKPLYLSEGQANLVSIASDLILPKTDTPGANDVGVPQLIDVLFGKYMSDEEKSSFSTGLNALEAAGFANQSGEDQTKTLTALGSTHNAFVTKLRELVVTGYFTSETVCTQVTAYDPVPGGFVGCVPTSETGNVIMSEPR